MAKDISKFSWAELFSNESGKTSATAFCGVVICISGTLTFVLGCIDKMWVTHTIDVINQSIMFVTIGAALMGVRKVVDSKIQPQIQQIPEQLPEQPQDQMIQS
jgi:hypothetical protein